MKKLAYVFSLILLLALTIASVCSAAENEYEVVLSVDCAENLIFAKFDVDVYVDDEKIGKVSHGKKKSFTLTLSEGPHDVVFTKHGDESISGETTITLSTDQTWTFSITCHTYQVSIDKEVKEFLITEARKELQQRLESVFPQEKAKRVAVVAMTNRHATDVFKQDGNTYDTSKFHDYSDYSGYFLSVEEEGTWWAVDERTWHVDGMLFIMSGTGTYMKASMDICFDGSNYQVASVDTAIGSLWDIKRNNTEYLNCEHIEPSDRTPYLNVSPKLIAKDRDEEALRDWLHRTTPTEARTTWIDNQFGVWKGNHEALEKLIKKSLNDEKSYKHIETTYIDITTQEKLDAVNDTLKALGVNERAQMGDLFIITEFSAKNGFNATIKATGYGLVSFQEGTVTLLGIE